MWEEGSKKQEGGVSNESSTDYFRNLQDALRNYSPVLPAPPSTPVESQDYTIAPHRLWKENQNNPEYSLFRKKATGLASLEQGASSNSLPLAQQGLNTFDPIEGAVQEGLYGNQPKPNFQQYQTPPPASMQFSTAMPPQQGYQPTDYSKNFAQNNPPPTYSATNFGYNTVPQAPNTEVSKQPTNPLAAKSGSGYQTDASGNPQGQYEDWVKYNIINPYNQGMDLSTSLTYTGQQFGQGHTGMGVAGAGLSLLKGTRNFLSGYGAGKQQKNVEQQMHEKLYNSDETLYGDRGNIGQHQQGGLIEDELEGYFPGIAQNKSQSAPAQEEFLGGQSPTAYNGNKLDVDFYTPEGTPEAAAPTASTTTEAEAVNFDKNSARDTWEKKTGLPWSEAKRRGYTDGTAKDNTKLLGELNDPRFKKESLRSTPFTSPTQVRQQAREAAQAVPTPTVRPSGSIQDFLNKKGVPSSGRKQDNIGKKEDEGILGTLGRYTEYLANPLQTFGEYAKYSELPAHGFSKHSENAYDMGLGVENPAYWLSKANNALDFTEQGEYQKAAIEALGALPAAQRLKWVKDYPILLELGQGKGVSNKALGEGAKRLGQAPQLRLHQEGGYVVGKEYELDEEEIQNLRNQGYKIRNV
jgi:hypothetical protein